jgi:predicted DNA-binding protein (UPF0251 family)
MPRPRQKSKIQLPPRVKGFAPVGYNSNQSDKVLLNIEEYECIRLLDYEGLSQEGASLLMGISRPTLTRIYERARKKVAVMLTEARQLSIEGGSSIYSDKWYVCEQCDSKFNNTNNKTIIKCPLCSSMHFHLIIE